MLKKTITYTDFDGDEQTDDFYFNLTKSEIVTLELSGPQNSFSEAMRRIVASKDGKTIMSEFKKVILMSIGIKSDDGKRFIKSDQISQDFLNSAAYDVLFIELTQEADKAAEWITGLMPQDMKPAVQDAAAARKRSEAALQGHKQKEQTSVTREEDLPTLNLQEGTPDPDPESAPEQDLSKLTKAQLMELLSKK